MKKQLIAAEFDRLASHNIDHIMENELEDVNEKIDSRQIRYVYPSFEKPSLQQLIATAYEKDPMLFMMNLIETLYHDTKRIIYGLVPFNTQLDPAASDTCPKHPVNGSTCYQKVVYYNERLKISTTNEQSCSCYNGCCFICFTTNFLAGMVTKTSDSWCYICSKPILILDYRLAIPIPLPRGIKGIVSGNSKVSNIGRTPNITEAQMVSSTLKKRKDFDSVVQQVSLPAPKKNKRKSNKCDHCHGEITQTHYPKNCPLCPEDCTIHPKKKKQQNSPEITNNE